MSFFPQKEELPASVDHIQSTAEQKAVVVPETLKTEEAAAAAARRSSQTQVEPGQGGQVEYTELTLDCLDLKAQEELLSPPLSGDPPPLLAQLHFSSL